MSLSKQKGSSFWYCSWDINGKRYRKSTKTKNRALAEKVADAYRDELLKKHVVGDRDPITLQEAAELLWKTKPKLSHSPIKRLLDHIKPTTLLSDITEAHLEDYLNDAKETYKPGTINVWVSHLHSLLKVAHKRGFACTVHALNFVKNPPTRVRVLSLDEEAKVLKEFDTDRWVQGDAETREYRQLCKDFSIALLDTGARPSELWSLKWSAVNMEEGSFVLWRNKVKNQSIIYMTERLKRVITRRQGQYPGELVFSTDGKPRTRWGGIKKALERAGLPHFTMRDFRHVAATRLLASGLTLYEVSRILGHSNIVTSTRYAHLVEADVSKKAKEVLDQALLRHQNNEFEQKTKGKIKFWSE